MAEEDVPLEALESVEDQLRELERVKVLLAEFNETEIAKYFVEICKNRLSEINKDLQVADDIKTVKFLQGQGNSVDFWLKLPQVLVERMETDIKMARAQLDAKKESRHG